MTLIRQLFYFVLLLLLVPVPALAQQESFTLEGVVIQGTTEGKPLPENLPLTLRILNPNAEEIATYSATSQAEGAFIFANIPRYDDHFYVVSTSWAGIEQSTIPIKPPELQGALQFPLYELTDSLANVVGNRGNLRIEFNAVNDLGLEMLLELGYTNLGDRIVWGNINTAEAQSFTVELPVGALGISPEAAPGEIQRYQALDAINSLPIPGIRDTQPLVPNWPNIMRVSFFVPYENGAVVDMRFPFAVSDIGVFVRENTVTVESDLLALGETTQTSSGRIYNVYTQTRALNPGEPFKFTLSGTPREATPAVTATEDNSSPQTVLLIVGLGALLIFAVLLIWLYLARQAQKKIS